MSLSSMRLRENPKDDFYEFPRISGTFSHGPASYLYNTRGELMNQTRLIASQLEFND